MCIQLHTVCKSTHWVYYYTLCVKLHTMCGIKTTFMITQGCVAFSMEKNSSHLKNFTLTSLVALVTIMRYVPNTFKHTSIFTNTFEHTEAIFWTRKYSGKHFRTQKYFRSGDQKTHFLRRDFNRRHCGQCSIPVTNKLWDDKKGIHCKSMKILWNEFKKWPSMQIQKCKYKIAFDDYNVDSRVKVRGGARVV